MSLMRRVSNLLSRAKADREIDAELRSHIEMRVEENLAVGMTPEEARRDALVRFGNLATTKEKVAHMDMALTLDSIWADIRFAWRQLFKNPGFAFTAIAVLMLSVGSGVATFAFVDAALIKPLPYRDPSHLVALYESTPVGDRYHISYADYLDWKRLNHAFASLDVYDLERLTISAPGGVIRVPVARVSDGFFRTLGTSPMLGRGFVQGEDQPSAPQTVILSYAAWQKRFGANRSVIGTTVTLDGTSFVVVGVLEPGFHFAPVGPAEFWITLHGACGVTTDRDCHRYYGVARLRDGVTRDSAHADLQTIALQIAQNYPASNRDRGATTIPLTEVILGEIRPILLALLCGAGLLLTIGFINVASLLVARAESRKREVAVRGALGASRNLLVRQFAVEAILLTVSGIAAALGSALIAINVLRNQIPLALRGGMPYLHEARFNAHLSLLTGVTAVACVLVFSAVPAIRFFSADMQEALHGNGRSVAGNSWRKLGSKLVATEIAIAVVLLTSAGLLGRSFHNLLHVDIGIAPERLAVMHVIMPIERTDKERVQLERRILAQMTALPGVTSAGISFSVPVNSTDNWAHFRVAGRTYIGEGDEANDLDAGVGYFETVRARLLAGRFFTDSDNASSRPVVVINETMAKQMFPSENPIGKHIIDQYRKTILLEVVGVIHDIQEETLDVSHRAAAYTPYEQIPDSDLYITTRTALSNENETVLHSMPAVVHQIDPAVITEDPDTLVTRINDTPAAYLHRSAAWLVGGFAGIALLLGTVGLYGVIAYSVSQRTREIGVRMALGAQRGTVYRLILGEAGWLTVIGTATGLVGAVPAAMLLRKLLYGTQAWDASTLASVVVVMAASALLASYFPARRAASVNPVDALRAE